MPWKYNLEDRRQQAQHWKEVWLYKVYLVPEKLKKGALSNFAN